MGEGGRPVATLWLSPQSRAVFLRGLLSAAKVVLGEIKEAKKVLARGTALFEGLQRSYTPDALLTCANAMRMTATYY